MKCFGVSAIALAITFSLGSAADVRAAGSWGGSSGGGYASSGGDANWGGGSSGGDRMGFFARLKARHAAAGSTGGSSGGAAYAAAYGGSSGGVSAGSSGGVSAGSSGGSNGGGHVGPLRRLMAKIRAHKAAKHAGGSNGGSSGGVTYASYAGGSSGGSASSGGSTYSYGSTANYGGGSSGGYSSYGGYPSSGHSVSMGANATYEAPMIESSYESYTPMGETIIDGGSYMNEPAMDGTIMDAPISDPVPMDGSNLDGGSVRTDQGVDSVRYESAKPALDADAAMLTVAVPEGAVVTVNGHPTTSNGGVRQFMSRGLKEGFVYTYVVDVTYSVNGTEKKESKSIKLRPGDEETVEFEVPEAEGKTSDDLVDADQADIVTIVKLHVPADAEVSLAGNATSGEGELRTFRTRQLKPGQQWTGYTVRVTTEIAGQAVSKERTVDVEAGSTTELTFDFADNSIASR